MIKPATQDAVFTENSTLSRGKSRESRLTARRDVPRGHAFLKEKRRKLDDLRTIAFLCVFAAAVVAVSAAMVRAFVAELMRYDGLDLVRGIGLL